MCFFHFEREITKLGQADHASTAFQGVKAAPYRRQRLAVVRTRMKLDRAGGDRVEHLVGFGQINVEQLGIELRGVGLEQTHRFLGRRRRRLSRPS